MLILVYILSLLKCYTIAGSYVILDEFRNCKEKQDTLIVNMTRANLHSAPDGLRQFVDTDLHCLQDFPNGITVEVNLEKCKNKESPDTCMKFTTLKTSKYCEVMEKYFENFLDCYTPRMRCPLQKNLYKARNCYLDLSRFRMFPLTGVYWKMTAQMVYRNKKIGCGYAGGIVLNK